MAVELIAWLLELAHIGAFPMAHMPWLAACWCLAPHAEAGLAQRLVEHTVGLLTSGGLFCTDHVCLTGALSHGLLFLRLCGRHCCTAILYALHRALADAGFPARK